MHFILVCIENPATIYLALSRTVHTFNIHQGVNALKKITTVYYIVCVSVCICKCMCACVPVCVLSHVSVRVCTYWIYLDTHHKSVIFDLHVFELQNGE